MEIFILLARKIGNFIIANILFGNLKSTIEPDSDISGIIGFAVTLLILIFTIWIAMSLTI